MNAEQRLSFILSASIPIMTALLSTNDKDNPDLHLIALKHAEALIDQFEENYLGDYDVH